ncbi:MAG: hypothetical protein WC470_01470 [Candidatus Paceibacterota bacterium]
MENIILIDWGIILTALIQAWPIWLMGIAIIIFLEALKFFLAKLEKRIKAKRNGKKF